MIIWGGYSRSYQPLRPRRRYRVPVPRRVTQQDNSKLAPKGTASKSKLSQSECDKKFAKLFGGEGAVVGSVSDPLSLGRFDKLRKEGTLSAAHAVRGKGHGPAPFNNPKSYDRGGIIHVYGDARGNTLGKPLYALAGERVGRLHMQGPNEVRHVSYSTGLTISFFTLHIAKRKILIALVLEE